MITRRVHATGRLVVALGVAFAAVGTQTAAAQEAPVGLGTAGSFAVLAGSTVSNTGPSVIGGDVGLSPGTAVVGFPPGLVGNGSIHATDAVALQAQADLVTAYNDAAGRATTATVSADLGGQTLVSGVYTSPDAQGLTGTLTLDAQGNPDAVFVFQVASALTTASSSVVSLINGANPCNVYWQIGSSATLGTNSVFVGTVMALTSITATTGVNVQGRLLARNGAVTLDTNVITASACFTTPAPTTTTTTTTVAPADTAAPSTAPTTVAPADTAAPEATSPDDTTPAAVTTSPPSGTGVDNTLPGDRDQTTTTTFRVTDITIPRTGASATPTSIGAGAFLALGAIALLVSRRRRPV